MSFGSGYFGSGAMGSTGVSSGSPCSGSSDCNDPLPPVVNNFVPPNFSEITPEQLIQFDVTDNKIFRAIFVVAGYASTGLYEIVHDGTNFSPFYQAGSTRSIIPNGFRYFVKRFNGWPSSPIIRVYAIDGGGNQAIP